MQQNLLNVVKIDVKNHQKPIRIAASQSQRFGRVRGFSRLGKHGDMHRDNRFIRRQCV